MYCVLLYHVWQYFLHDRWLYAHYCYQRYATLYPHCALRRESLMRHYLYLHVKHYAQPFGDCGQNYGHCYSYVMHCVSRMNALGDALHSPCDLRAHA